MSRCKARGTGATHEVWGVQAKRGQILRNEAYIEVRRSDEGCSPASGGSATQQMGVFPHPVRRDARITCCLTFSFTYD